MKIFFRSFALILFHPQISHWFRRAALKCLVLSVFLIIALMAGGAYVISHLGDRIWFDIGAIAWALLLFFFSGTLTAAFLTLFLGIFGNEEGLLRVLTERPDLKLKKGALKWRWRELWGTLFSVLISLLAAPFFIFPLTLPVGLLLLAWGLGGELLACSDRLLFQSGLVRAEELKRKPQWLRISVGLGPAAMGLFPVLSWFLWPIALLVALRVQLQMQNFEKTRDIV